MFPLHVILHPTDFSPSSEQAFHLACSLARDHGARLIALHVLERPLIIQSGVMTPPPPPAPRARAFGLVPSGAGQPAPW
jgi:nucleotide-binding universal stress UspA family protein